VGVQLDIFGKYVGIDRFYSGFNVNNQKYFGYLDYNLISSDNQTGYSNYADFSIKTGRTLKYADIFTGTNKLNDDDFRVLLKLRIVQNNINHSRKSIDDSLYKFFGSSLYASALNKMTMDYFIPKSLKNLAKIMAQKQVLPKPMGMRIIYIIPKNAKFSGFATYNLIPENIAGFSTYQDYDVNTGESLTYNSLMEV